MHNTSTADRASTWGLIVLLLAIQQLCGVPGPLGNPAGNRVVGLPAESDTKIHGPYLHSRSDTTINAEWWLTHPSRITLEWRKKGTDWVHQEPRLSANWGSYSLTGLKSGTDYQIRIRLEDGTVGDTVTIATATEPHNPVTYYVAPDGDNHNPGTSRERPFATISHAAATVLPGDTVKIAGGTYVEAVNLRATGDEGRPITFTPISGETVNFDGSERTLSYAFFAQNKSHIKIDGFYFRNYRFGSEVLPWSAFMRGRNSNIVLYYCNDIEISRCFSDGMGPGTPPGLLFAVHSRDVHVHNSVVTRAMGSGISLYACPGMVVEHNVFLRNLISNMSEVVNEPDDTFIIRNNIFTDNLPSKVHAGLFAIGQIESIEEDTNCYFLRIPDAEKRPFQFYAPQHYDRPAEAWNMRTQAELDRQPIITELTRMSVAEFVEQFAPHSRSIVTDPLFAGAKEWQGQKNNRGDIYFTPDPLCAKDGLDFADLFATNPEVIDLNIGLQPEKFENF